MTALVILKLVGGRIWTFLSHASFWQLAFGAALIFAGWERLQLSIEKRHSAKVEAQLVKVTATLKAITTARDEQKQVTGGNIVKAESGRVKADSVAKRIEQAPVVAGCKTPSEILQADL